MTMRDPHQLCSHNMNLTFLLLFMTILCSFGALSAPTADEIHDLPGLRVQPPFKHYSGYLRASPTRFLHYWFVESQTSPQSDPLVLWMNGGPGCSSLDGLLSEHGPYLVTERGDLQYNSQSWNKIANVLYLEAPAGVGFSYASDKNIQSDDDSTAQENYNALIDFFRKFPNYLQNDFYISGESYGGVYVPTLSRLVMRNETMRLKGLLVGNGLSSYTLNDNSLLYFAQYHGLLGETLWHEMLTQCCAPNATEFCLFTENKKPACQKPTSKAVGILDYGLNIYNLYSPCYGGVPGSGNFLQNVKKAAAPYLDVGGNLFRDMPFVQSIRDSRRQLRGKLGVGLDPPCTNSTAISQYLNSRPVRAALHIPPEVDTWAICSEDVGTLYGRNYQEMSAVYKDLLKPQKYRILIYNGDIDMACNFLGDEWFFDAMNMKLSDARRPWVFQDTDGTHQIGGYTKAWSTGVVFATIRGAGHMVPQDLPVPSFHMFSRFINNKPL